MRVPMAAIQGLKKGVAAVAVDVLWLGTVATSAHR